MIDEFVQISKDKKCSNCKFLIIAKSIMHLIGGKYYCASCAAGIRKEGKK